jgi:hypothetical protein
LRKVSKANLGGIIWLGGLDSNQDSQIQSLESYQLDDLPAGRNKKESQHSSRGSGQPRFDLSNLIWIGEGVNQSSATENHDFSPISFDFSGQGR